MLSACTTAQTTTTQIHTASVEITSHPNNVLNATSISTANPKLVCPNINPDIQLNIPVKYIEFQSLILDYLNSGGDPTKVQPATTSPEIPSFYSIAADIDGDSLLEVIVSTRDYFEKPATIYIYQCKQDGYRLVKKFWTDRGFGNIEFVAKIFSSEPPYVIFRSLDISGLRQFFYAVGWYKSEWRFIHLGIGTTPSEIAFFDQNTDGEKEFFLKTINSDATSNDVNRAMIETYSWNGDKFIPTSKAISLGNDRVHYLGDAESAWKAGNPLLSINYYEIAARDSSISSYWTTYELENNQIELAKPYQQAFAYFRIIAIWYYLDRPETASQYLLEMSDTFPNGKAGNEFLLAAQELANGYEIDTVFSLACAKAVYFLDTQYPGVVLNHLGDWGTTYPMYFETSDICKLE